jgi:hypothetical protein
LGNDLAWPVGWIVDTSATKNPKMMNDNVQSESNGEENDLNDVGEQTRLMSEPATGMESRGGLNDAHGRVY